jgi:hypothetical protein
MVTNIASFSAFFAGAVFGFSLNATVLLPREAALAKSALVLLASLLLGGAVSFAVLLLGGTPRPLSETHMWLYRGGLLFGAVLGYFLGSRYAGRPAEADPFSVGLLGGAVLAVLFHWIAPAGTDTFAAAAWFVGIGGVGGFLWQWHSRRSAKRSEE